MNAKQVRQEEAKTELRKMLKKGDTVWTVLRHVSSSGMSRRIDLYVMRDNEPLRITWRTADALGYRYDRKHEALVVSGCGMDMGFHVVNSLSTALFCPNGYTHEGAYALNHRWM